MLYTPFNVGGKELKLRLGSRQSVMLERKMGGSPLDIFTQMKENSMPQLGDLLMILHGSLQALEHGYTEDKVYDLYDEFVAEGGTLADLMPTILDIFKSSGFFKEDKKVEDLEGTEGKN